jgi:hypothetical protein
VGRSARDRQSPPPLRHGGKVAVTALLPPVLIDNSPEREFDDIQPGDPHEAEEVAKEAAERERDDPGGTVQHPAYSFAGSAGLLVSSHASRAYTGWRMRSGRYSAFPGIPVSTVSPAAGSLQVHAESCGA